MINAVEKNSAYSWHANYSHLLSYMEQVSKKGNIDVDALQEQIRAAGLYQFNDESSKLFDELISLIDEIDADRGNREHSSEVVDHAFGNLDKLRHLFDSLRNGELGGSMADICHLIPSHRNILDYHSR